MVKIYKGNNRENQKKTTTITFQQNIRWYFQFNIANVASHFFVSALAQTQCILLWCCVSVCGLTLLLTQLANQRLKRQ